MILCRSLCLSARKRDNLIPFFGDFFSTYTTIPKAVISKPVRIKVNPLPGTKPDDFSGIAGRITLNSSLNKDTVNVNDAVNLKIVIAGNGNLKMAGAPELETAC